MLAGTAVALAVAAPAHANLIVNPGAEDGPASGANYADVPVTGFAPETGAFTAVRYGSGAFPSAAVGTQIGGGANFFTGGAAAVSTGQQRVDLGAFAAAIDAGAGSYTLSAYLGGYASQGDDARVEARFLGAGDAPLGSVTIGPVSAAERGNQTTLLPRSATGTAPAGARAVLITLTLTRAAGVSNDGYADNLSFTMASPAGAPAVVPSPSATPRLSATAGGALPNGGRAVTVTPSAACRLTATTSFLVTPPRSARASEKATRRAVRVLTLPGVRVTVPPVSVTAITPGQPVTLPVKPVTVRVRTPRAPRRAVNPPPVRTVTTVRCTPLEGVFRDVVGLRPNPNAPAAGARSAGPVTVPTRVDPPPAPEPSARLTAGLWSGSVRETFPPAPAGRVSFQVLADGTVRDFVALGVGERCYSSAGSAQGGSVVSQPFFVGVRLSGRLQIPVGRLPATGTYAYAPAAPPPSGIEYIRITDPGLVFDGADTAVGTLEAFRRIGGASYCQLRFTFTARPGGTPAAGAAGFTYLD